MQYQGTIYRPWPEAGSLLIQATLGCSNNRCTFCGMFRDKRFRIRERNAVLRDIAEARALYDHVDTVFIIDGNVLVVKTDFLMEIVERLRATFPECERISLYAGLNDLRRKPIEDLKALKQAGLGMAYCGLESGDRWVLERINKGLTPEQALEGMNKAKLAGIDVLLSIVLGLGGRERSREHIEETTRLLNLMQPEQLAPMALAIQPGTELAGEVERGEFILPTPMQLLEEELYLLENLSGFDCYYWGDHGNNLSPMKGRLPTSRGLFLDRIAHAMHSHPAAQQDTLHTYPW